MEKKKKKFDSASVFGLAVALATLTGGMFLSGPLTAFWDVPSVVIVFGGTIGATWLTVDTATIRAAPRMLKLILRKDSWDPEPTIRQMVGYAEQARRDGIISLDKEIKNINDDFTVKAMQLLVDGTEPELIKDIMENEVIFLEERHQKGVEMFNTAGQLSPAFGFLGTLIGLIVMLGQLSTPEKMGPAMAVALVTTLYGVILSNVVFLPFAGKLKLRNTNEILMKELVIEGVMSIQSGDNPRIVEEKLKTFLAPSARHTVTRKRVRAAEGVGGAATEEASG